MKRVCKNLSALIISGLILFGSSFWLAKNFNGSLINNLPIIEQDTKIEHIVDGTMQIHSQLKIIRPDKDKDKDCDIEENSASASNSNDPIFAAMNYPQSAVTNPVSNLPVMFDSFTLDYQSFFTAWNFILFLLSFFGFSIFRKKLNVVIGD